jgi:hypothetical protein
LINGAPIMEIPESMTGIAQLATAMSQSRLGEEVSVAVLKKSIDLQEQTAAQMIQSLPAPVSSLPDHLGTKVNTTA